MDAEARADGARKHEPLPPAANVVFFSWIAFALLLLGWFLSVNSDAGVWEDMVNLVALGFVVICLVAIGIAWLVARYAISGQTGRILTAIFGPPLLAGLVPLTLWLL